MTTLLLTTPLLMSIRSADANTISNGRYVFTCSKLYSGLCDITSTNGQYRMVPIENYGRGYIDFKRSWTGKLKITKSNMGSSEVALNLTGTAKPFDDRSFAGRVRLSYYAIPLIPGRISWAKWSLRPATREEIHAGLLNGLIEASGALANNRRYSAIWEKRGKEPWSEETLVHYGLLGGRNHGYSHFDVPQLLQWYREGILKVVDNHFELKKGIELTNH